MTMTCFSSDSVQKDTVHKIHLNFCRYMLKNLVCYFGLLLVAMKNALLHRHYTMQNNAQKITICVQSVAEVT